MPENIRVIVSQFIEELKKILGASLSKVIVYGSYARGEATPYSDVDIMMLVDLDDMEIKKVFRYYV